MRLPSFVVSSLFLALASCVVWAPAPDFIGEPETWESQSGTGALITEEFEGSGRCVEVCNAAFGEGCGVTEDCVSDCEQDLIDCPAEMEAVIACHLEVDLTCTDEGEDQGIDPGDCWEEHEAVHACGHDPF